MAASSAPAASAGFLFSQIVSGGAIISDDDAALLRQMLSDMERPLHVLWQAGATSALGKPDLNFFARLKHICNFLKAGCRVTIVLADMHAHVDRAGSSWELLQLKQRYYEEIIKAMLGALGALDSGRAGAGGFLTGGGCRMSGHS